MKILRYLFVMLIVASFVIVNFSTGKALTSALVQVTNFGTNPSGLGMYVYIPTTVKANPPILVVVHWCTGSAQAIYSGTQFAALADMYGYIVVYPSATRSGNCFDVSSTQALTRGGGSDPVGIMSMVNYAAQNYNGDLNQVYVTGLSSGAMMTNVLLGDYPDVFKAGAAFAGVPFGCFATTTADPTNPANAAGWNNTCSSGNLIQTPQAWGDLVRAAYPGYTGARPRMQLWHGTEDTALAYPNFGEEIKQWTNVHGISQTPNSTDYPQTNFTRTRYTNSAGAIVVEAISELGVTHSIAYNEAEVLRFFGLDGSIPPTPVPSITPGGPTLTPTRTPTITNTPVIGLQIKLQGGSESTSLSNFNLQISNTGAASLSNVSWRLYFNTENGNAASGYALEKYYDQSNAATISGPTLACGSTYYYTVTYGAALPAGTTWGYNSAFHLSSYATTIDVSNDWWHTGYGVGALPAAFTLNTFVPGYANGSLLWGGEPVCGSTGTATITPTPSRTSTLAATFTATATPTRSLTPAISSTPTRTSTMSNTPTRTVTPAISNTPTRTPTTGPTSTRTNTPAVTPTRTITPTTGVGACSPVTSTITAPFTFDGGGTYCWQSTNLGTYINNWNASSVILNGVNILNMYVASGSYPAKINGYWYVSFTSAVSYAHFEAK